MSESLEAAISYQFSDPGLLREAMTHVSVNLLHRGVHKFGYERLEFLGDRILGFVVADMLLDHFPDEPEGDIAKRFTALVCRETLAEVAEEIGIGQHLILSVGEEDIGGRKNPALLADGCESLIGAIYKDSTMQEAEKFIRHFWHPLLATVIEPPQDAKSALQEWAQGRGKPIPAYTEIAREGPDHAPVFTIEVTVGGEGSATATGPTKRIAQKQAAEILLEQLTNK